MVQSPSRFLFHGSRLVVSLFLSPLPCYMEVQRLVQVQIIFLVGIQLALFSLRGSCTHAFSSEVSELH